MDETHAIGVDIGGSHITAAVVNLDTQRILLPTLKRAAVNAQGNAGEIIAAWCRVIIESCKQFCPEPVKIGIAMPGPFDYEQGIAFMQGQNKFDSLFGQNVKNLLAEGLSMAPQNITFLNDAACFLKGEVFGGAAVGHHHVLGLTLGTGFGSAICNEGVVEDANLWCDPYRDGIAEDLFSTRWFVQRYFEHSGQNVKDVKEMLEGGNANAVAQVFREFGENLGQYLLTLSQRFAFNTVVIGGNIANSFALFAEPLQQVFDRHARPVLIKRTALNENAALVGAASVWKNEVSLPQTV